MKVVKSKGVNKSVILLKLLDDEKLIVVDEETTIRYLDSENFGMLGGFKVNIKHKYYKSSVVAFSNDGQYFGSLTADHKESRFFNAKTKKLIARVDRHHGEVSCLGIDPLNRYLFSCGDDGKTFAVDIKSGKLVFTLPTHVDTVNDIAFSKNGNWVATCSYDRKISLFSLVSMSAKVQLKAHAAAIMKIQFLTNNRLVSVDKNSSAIIWDLSTGKVIERLQGIHDEIRQIVTSENDRFLFIGTALGYVLLYDLQTYELLSSRYIKIASPITAMEFDSRNHELLIGTDDGFIFTYNIYEGEEKLKEYLKLKKFVQIQTEAGNNPVLATTKIYKLVTDLWENTLKKAKIALQKQDKETAILLFKNFKNIPAKNSIIQKIMNEYVEFPKFEKLIKENKLSLAYGIVRAHPMYKDSSLYKAVEKRWKNDFIKAQKYILDPKTVEKAKDIFAPYRGISEKTKLIQELLTKGDIYKRFRVAIGQKDFISCFELIKRHSFLKKIPEYEILTKYADTLYMKSHEFMNKGDTHSAIKMLRILSVFDDFKDEVKELMHSVEAKGKFFTAIENEDITVAYDMMSELEELEEIPDGKKLQKQWQKDQSRANEAAMIGDAISVKKILQRYMKIRSKAIAIATLYSWCYMVQLEDMARENGSQHDIEKGIKNYMLSFGLIEQIENFFVQFKEKYPTTKLNLEQLKQGSLEMWRPSMIVPSILD